MTVKQKKLRTDWNYRDADVQTTDNVVPGLMLRPYQDGTKAWVLKFVSPRTKKQRTITLGVYSGSDASMTLAMARTKAIFYRDLIKNPPHIDPYDFEEMQAALTASRMTFQQLYDKWRELSANDRKDFRKEHEVERLITKHILKPIGHKNVGDGNREFDIALYNTVIDPLKVSAPYVANQVHSYLNILLDFAVTRKAIIANPCRSFPRPFRDTKARTSNLDRDEIWTVWNSLPKIMENCPRYVPLLRLYLATGQRPSEVCGMETGKVVLKDGKRVLEIDTDECIWTIPWTRTKNKKDHLLPLSDLMICLILDALVPGWREVHKFNDPVPASDRTLPLLKAALNEAGRAGRKYVFPSEHGSGPVRQAVVGKTLKRLVSQFGLETPLTQYVLRHTFVTQMEDRKNRFQIGHLSVDYVLNHISSTESTVKNKHYNHAEQIDEKKSVLDQWGAFLTRLVYDHGAIKIAAE
jgi:integrase